MEHIVNEKTEKLDWSSYQDHPAFAINQQMQGTAASDRVLANEQNAQAAKSQTPKQNWEMVLNDASLFFRETLLPRGPGSGSNFLIDQKKDIDWECDYPRWITPWQYRYMYDREGIAQRVNDIFTDECFAIPPEIYETEAGENTEFEQDLSSVLEKTKLLHYIKRLDAMSGIGYYGALLYGWNDGLPLDRPVPGIDPVTGRLIDATKDPEGVKKYGTLPPNLQINYLRVFDETQVRILRFCGDRSSPRYAQPELYWVRFIEVTRGETGAIAGEITAQVHWTRMEHAAKGRQSSEVFGTPTMQSVWNRLYDLRKILSSSGEMYWKGGFPGLSFEINPEIAAEVTLDDKTLREEFERYSQGLQRYLAVRGLNVKSLAPQIASPEKHFEIQIRAICIAKGTPLRVFMGTEQQQRTTSTEEAKSWNKKLSAIQEDYLSPWLIRPIINRLIAYGVVRPPANGKYFIAWKDLNTVSDADQAELAFKRTQALAQYINGFVYEFIMPTEYLVTVAMMSQEEAEAIVLAAGGTAAILARIQARIAMSQATQAGGSGGAAGGGGTGVNKMHNALDGGVQIKTQDTAADKLEKSKGSGQSEQQDGSFYITPTSQGGVQGL